ncbi:cytochrome P450 78A5-like [Iris pallida]|uniref:Cytochrome P450 78A5-like n=1 Tax=Iris pallida TaxID=29817 RepID=A0AAX6HZY0_IRIPA|nr:cytochrome P450 78A5-like [Iris pallida]
MSRPNTTASLCLLLTLMASHAPWHFITLGLTLSLVATYLILSSRLVPGGSAWRNPSRGGLPTPPGPAGWPILGSIPIMGPLAHRKLARLSKAHGATRLMAFSLGTTPAVISSHPDTAREILSGAAFSDRPVKASARHLMFERAIGFAPSGEYWRRLRRMAAANMFSPRRVAALEGVRQRVADDMVGRVGKAMGRAGTVAVRDVLQKGSLESVIGSVFGEGALGAGEEEVVVGMVKEGYELIGRFNWEDHFPLGSLLDFHGVGRRCKCLSERVKVLFGNIIEERRRAIGSTTDCSFKQDHDFLTVLLSMPQEERLNDADIIAVLWEMIFRGTDVVAVLLEWIMARMVLHPDVQSKAQEELDALVGARPVRDSDVPSLRYLQSIVKEVLRMHPPGPLLSWARIAVHDAHVGKFFVPAGTTAMVNMWAIAHDGSLWEDPSAFRPERFLEEDVSVMGSDLRLAPFGSGRRVCPGRALGLATVHLWLARFLQSYTWGPDRPVQLSERLRLSLEMKKPLVCRVAGR